MARQSDGITEQIGPRITPEELQMLVEVGQLLSTSSNRAIRYAIRVAWQHATSTEDHTQCPGNSPCAAAIRGISGVQRRTKPTVPEGQTLISHVATVEDTT